MQLTVQCPVLITHMDGGVPFVTSAMIVAQGSESNIGRINEFLFRVYNSIANHLFCMSDEDVEVEDTAKLTLVSDYVSIDNCSLQLTKIKRVRATAEHDYSCICCSVEDFYHTYPHVPQAERDFDFEIIPADSAEEMWIESAQPFGQMVPAMLTVPVIEILPTGVWESNLMVTDDLAQDKKVIIINHSSGSVTASGFRVNVVNTGDSGQSSFTALSPFFKEFAMFRNTVLAQ